MDEINDVAMLNAIGDIADRAADDQASGDGLQPRIRRHRAKVPEQPGDDEQRDDEEDIARHRQDAECGAGVAAARQLEEWGERWYRLITLVGRQIRYHPALGGLVKQRRQT